MIEYRLCLGICYRLILEGVRLEGWRWIKLSRGLIIENSGYKMKFLDLKV